MAILYSRRGDQNIPQNKAQQLSYQAAKRAIAAKQYTTAAEHFLRGGMNREAIEVLEHHGFVTEAAHILMDMNNYPRAGFLLARNRHFIRAYEAFQHAGMFTEAAMAAKKANRFDIAAQLYVRAGQSLNAAQCYLKTGHLLKAARCFALVKKHQAQAASCYALLVQRQGRAVLTPLDHANIYRCLREHHTSPQLIHGILGTKYFAPLTIFLLKQSPHKNILVLIRGLLKHATHHELNHLITTINPTASYAKSLGSHLAAAHQFAWAGQLWERTGDFERAAGAFQQAGQRQRANQLLRGRSPRPSEPSRAAPQSQRRMVASPPSRNKPQAAARPRRQLPAVTIHNCSTTKPPKSYYFAHIFVSLHHKECNELWEYGILKELQPPTKLYSSHEPAGHMSIILSGQLKETRTQRYIEESECLGELTLFTTTPRVIAAYATRPTLVFCISPEEFKQFALDQPSSAYKITTAYLSYLTETHGEILGAA